MLPYEQMTAAQKADQDYQNKNYGLQQAQLTGLMPNGQKTLDYLTTQYNLGKPYYNPSSGGRANTNAPINSTTVKNPTVWGDEKQTAGYINKSATEGAITQIGNYRNSTEAYQYINDHAGELKALGVDLNALRYAVARYFGV
jgi:hypothetical protein